MATESKDLHRVQCRATSRHGKQCLRTAIPGGYVCNFHGGASPLARQAARMRLLAMVEPAFGVLMELMADGTDEKTRLAAAVAVLDRVGMGPKSTIVVDDRRTQLAQLTDGELQQRISGLMAQAQMLNVTPMHQPILDAIAEDKEQQKLLETGVVQSSTREETTEQPAAQDAPFAEQTTSPAPQDTPTATSSDDDSLRRARTASKRVN